MPQLATLHSSDVPQNDVHSSHAVGLTRVIRFAGDGCAAPTIDLPIRTVASRLPYFGNFKFRIASKHVLVLWSKYKTVKVMWYERTGTSDLVSMRQRVRDHHRPMVVPHTLSHVGPILAYALTTR